MLSFPRDADVLDFRPWRQHKRFRSIHNVFWPAWAFRVLVPDPDRIAPRKLDLLERLVLGLCHAGQFDPEKIAELSGLHRDLAVHIVGELTSKGCLDPNLLLTPKGVKAYVEDSFEPPDALTEGFVLQDPWSATLHPVVPQELSRADVGYREDGFPTLMVERSGGRVRAPTYAQLPDEDAAPPNVPSATSILHAARRHNRAQRSNVRTNDEEDDYAPSMIGLRADRITLIDPNPIPVYLRTYLYIPQEDEQWFVANPFGRGSASDAQELRNSIEKRAATNPPLQGAIVRLFERSGIEDHQNAVHQNALRVQVAEQRVRRFLSEAVLDSFLYDRIVDLERHHLEYMQLGTDTSRAEIVLSFSRKVVERSLRYLLDVHPPGDVWRKLNRDTRVNRDLLASAYAGCGFDEPAPDHIFSLNRQRARSICEGTGEGVANLRPTVGILLFASAHDPAHPFHRLAAQAPNLLRAIDALARMGGRGSHDQDNDDLEPQQVLASVKDTYRIAGHIFDLPTDLTRYAPQPPEEITS